MTTQSPSFAPPLIDSTPSTVSVTRIAGLIAQIFQLTRNRLSIWKMRFDDRAYLARLQQFQLSEMGMTLDQRDREVNKPFWKE